MSIHNARMFAVHGCLCSVCRADWAKGKDRRAELRAALEAQPDPTPKPDEPREATP